MRQALTMALQEFEGAMVLVSHDRHLLRASTDTLLLVADGGCALFDGDLDDYRDWLQARRRQAEEPAAEGAAGLSRREQRRVEAQARDRRSAQRRPLERQLADVERDLAALGAQRQRLESVLADPNVYAADSRERLTASLQEQAQVTARLQQAEERWLELQAQLEALETR
jgi:ATP-binding cassette subfamily F protein 3